MFTRSIFSFTGKSNFISKVVVAILFLVMSVPTASLIGQWLSYKVMTTILGGAG